MLEDKGLDGYSGDSALPDTAPKRDDTAAEIGVLETAPE